MTASWQGTAEPLTLTIVRFGPDSGTDLPQAIRHHAMTEPTDAEQAAFEAGIKFGALYHQFAGTPVSTESAESLATAMAESIENQPFCENVEVHPLEQRIERAVAGLDPLDETADPASVDERNLDADTEVLDAGAEAHDADTDEPAGDATDDADYTELTGTLFDAIVEVERADTKIRAEMATEGDYPLMSLVDVERE